MSLPELPPEIIWKIMGYRTHMQKVWRPLYTIEIKLLQVIIPNFDFNTISPNELMHAVDIICAHPSYKKYILLQLTPEMIARYSATHQEVNDVYNDIDFMRVALDILAAEGKAEVVNEAFGIVEDIQRLSNHRRRIAINECPALETLLEMPFACEWFLDDE